MDAAGGLFDEFTYRVPASAIDYNGHLNDAAYASVLSNANERFLDHLGLGRAYRAASGCAVYTVEMDLRFLKEIRLGDVLRAPTRLVEHDTKRLRVQTMLVGQRAGLAASGSVLYLHVDGARGRVAPFPGDRLAVLQRTRAHHDTAARSPRL